ncbi:MAG: DNA polymerase III subunit delta [Deltaproteobacteria bacterium]
MSIEILKDNLKKGILTNVYLFWGSEDYLIKYYVGEIEARVVKPEFKSLNCVVLKGKESIKEIISTCETIPMMSENKMVIVKESEVFSDSASKKGKDNSDEIKLLCDYISNIPEGVCLVFLENQVNRKNILFKEVEKNGLCIEFDYQKMPELMRWVEKVFSSYKINIGKAEAEYLVSICDPGMNDIMNEIKKLVDLVGEENSVLREHIDSLCIKSVQSKVFEMIDAITNGNPSKAYKLLNDMLYLKEPIQKVSVLVARHFKIMFFVKHMSMKGYKQDKIAQEMNLNPYIVSKYIKQGAKYKPEVLRNAFREYLEIDRRTKTGRVDPRIALETFISKYSA